MEYKKVFYSFVGCVGLTLILTMISGCYYKATIDDPSKNESSILQPPLKSNKVAGSEFVSGSDQYELTPLRKYKVLASAGSYNRELKTKTANGYLIYSTVQGSLISSDGSGVK